MRSTWSARHSIGLLTDETPREMKVFVTGGTGLVGSHVIHRLKDLGHVVVALVRDEAGKDLVESLGATAVIGNVEDTDAWSRASDVDAIVHSAALITSAPSWERLRAVNVDGAKFAALTASKLGVRLVHVSSVAVYGRAGMTLSRIDEYTPWGDIAPNDFYARSKRMAEDVIRAVAVQRPLSYVSLRPCVIYGERDRTVLPRVIRLLRFGVAPLVGNGSNTLAIVYAGNVAEAVCAALERKQVTGAINVTNDGKTTQREFFQSVGRALGKRVILVRLPVVVARVLSSCVQLLLRAFVPGKYSGVGGRAALFLARNNPYSSDRARRELDWHPTTSPEDALRRSVRWFVDNA